MSTNRGRDHVLSVTHIRGRPRAIGGAGARGGGRTGSHRARTPPPRFRTRPRFSEISEIFGGLRGHAAPREAMRVASGQTATGRLRGGYKAVTKRLYSGYHGAAGGAEAVGLEEQGRIHLAVTRRRLRLSVDGYGYASTVTPRR